MTDSSTATMQMPDDVGPSRIRIAWEVGGNIVLALFFLQFLVAHGKEFLSTYRFSTLLLVIKVATDVVFYLFRRVPKEISISPYDWIVALLGTYMVACFRPEHAGSDNVIGQFMQTLGPVPASRWHDVLEHQHRYDSCQPRYQDRWPVPSCASPAVPELHDRLRRLRAQSDDLAQQS